MTRTGWSRSMFLSAVLLVVATALPGCASAWKIHGGPDECVQMCRNWGLVFAGMVGVGNQDATGDGATACVCQVAPNSEQTSGGSSATASLAGPITAAQAAAAAEAAHQQQVAAANASAATSR